VDIVMKKANAADVSLKTSFGNFGFPLAVSESFAMAAGVNACLRLQDTPV
jgi:hypothetical protein